MKYLLMTAALLTAMLTTEAQTGQGQTKRQTTGAQSNNASTTGKTASAQKGGNSTKTGQRKPVAQHHGPKDVTPGSPIGTGGTGGDNMTRSNDNTTEILNQTNKPAKKPASRTRRTTTKARGKG